MLMRYYGTLIQKFNRSSANVRSFGLRVQTLNRKVRTIYCVVVRSESMNEWFRTQFFSAEYCSRTTAAHAHFTGHSSLCSSEMSPPPLRRCLPQRYAARTWSMWRMPNERAFCCFCYCQAVAIHHRDQRHRPCCSFCATVPCRTDLTGASATLAASVDCPSEISRTSPANRQYIPVCTHTPPAHAHLLLAHAVDNMDCWCKCERAHEATILRSKQEYKLRKSNTYSRVHAAPTTIINSLSIKIDQ